MHYAYAIHAAKAIGRAAITLAYIFYAIIYAIQRYAKNSCR